MAKSVGSIVRAPEGFVSLTSVADAPWVELKAGNVVQGKLLGMYDREDKRNKKTGRSNFFQILLSAPCSVRVGRGEKVQITTAKAGDVVSLNHNPHTAKLEPACDKILKGAEYQVFVKIEGKINLQNGNTMWNMPPYARCTREANAAVTALPDFTDTESPEPAAAAEDDVSF